jgi:hypothetical protein
MIKLPKKRDKPDFGIVLTPEEQLALEYAMERVENMKGQSSIVETAGRIKFAWQLYVRFLYEEATAKAEGKDLKELQKISLERRRTLRILKLDLRRQPKPEESLSVLSFDAEYSETLLQLIARDMKRIQQAIRPHLSFEEKWENRLRKERVTKRRAQYKAKKKATKRSSRKKVQS